MTTDEVVTLLSNLEKRLTTIADQAEETRSQAQHTLERIDKLRTEVESLRRKALASMDTMEQPALPSLTEPHKDDTD